MKKWISLILAAVLCMSLLAGCGSASDDPVSEESEAAESSASEEGSDDAYAGSLSGITLDVGTDTSFIPFCYPDDDGVYTGFDIEILEALSEYLGFDYELTPMDFTALLMSVQSEKLDMGLAGITITEERQEVMDISDPYYDAGIYVLVSEDNDEIEGFEDLEGKTIATKEGTASADYVNENLADCTLNTFANISEAYLELTRGAADAVVYDSPNILYYLSQNPDSGLKVVGDLLDACQYGIVLQKDSEYTEYINAGLAYLMENGTYDELYEKWFGSEE